MQLYGLGMALAVAELLWFGTISRGSKMVDDCCFNLRGTILTSSLSGKWLAGGQST